MTKIISLIVPVFNEQATIHIFYETVRRSLSLGGGYDVEIVFVNDGSYDKTEAIIAALAAEDSHVLALSFTRNFGKEAALMCGLEHCTGDCAIPIDVDLQDPIEVIPRLITEWEKGMDLVLAKRVDRSSDSWLKRKTAQWFYEFHNQISVNKIEPNVGDFRLLSRQSIDTIKKLPERNLFMKGVLSWPGGRTSVVEYTRQPRVAGESKFNGWKLWNLALEGITSFSTVPLRIWTYLGAFISTTSFAYILFVIIQKLLWGNPVHGYPSLLCVILFLGGIQLIGIGILGEYIGRIYQETKQRPRYVLKKEKYDCLNEDETRTPTP